MSLLNQFLGLFTARTEITVSKEVIAEVVTRAQDDPRKFLTEAAGFLPDTYDAEDVELRQTWENCVANQIVQPLRYFKPDTYGELLDIILEARENNVKVKPIGSGHSFSDVGVTTDYLIDTHGLNRVLDIEHDLLKPTTETSQLFRMECGIRIRDLNDALFNNGLALINMGAYTAQTIIGAISTGTHGSGITLGPLADSVRSIDMITEEGKLIRIEPTDGITDPTLFKQQFPNVELKQDDDWFYSVVVSMGTVGVIYSLYLQVTDAYWLEEIRTLSTWKEAKALLEQGDILNKNRHVELVLSPYAVDGDYPCIITRRNIVPQPDLEPDDDRAHRNFFAEFIASIPGAEKAMNFIFNELPSLIPTFIYEAMKGLEDDGYIDRSYRVLDLGAANKISAYSAEVAFPMDQYIYAIEEILAMAERNREIGNVYQTSPIGVRFVKASEHYLAMQYGRDTVMIEMPVITGTFSGFEILHRYVNAMYKFGGRPHWGQVQLVSGNNNLIGWMYPKYQTWLSVYKQLSPKGMFSNTFTERCGFSSPISPQS